MDKDPLAEAARQLATAIQNFADEIEKVTGDERRQAIKKLLVAVGDGLAGLVTADFTPSLTPAPPPTSPPSPTR